MDLDENALPLTREQLRIWLAAEIGCSDTEWRLGNFLLIEGAVDADLLRQAIRQVVAEAEPLRAVFSEVDGQVFQQAVDYPDIEIPFHDLSSSADPVGEAYRLASPIQRAAMPLTGPLFRFALFRTRPDQLYLFMCCHHIVIDGFGVVALIANRIAVVYSAIAAGTPVPPAFFGSLRDLVAWELEYEASNDYLDDLAYWTKNLPQENALGYPLPQSEGTCDADSDFVAAPIQLDPSIVDRIERLSQLLGVRRSSVITAACALLVRGWASDGSQVVLDFPVSRRTTTESKSFPGMLAGVVPLALQLTPESSVADFCEYVHRRIGEVLRHQRFPVNVLENEGHGRGAGRASNRVGVNFIPSTTVLPFNGAPARGAPTTSGFVSHFGLFFFGDGDRIFLSTTGGGRPFSNFDVADLAARLEKVLAALVADPGRALSSVDVLDGAEHASVARWGNRVALSVAAGSGVSIPVVFAARVACAPEAVALTCGERSWTYRQLDEVTNRLAHLLVG
ncbi:non-ribosomal peptide synthetase, partial [Mycobacterium simiae]